MMNILSKKFFLTLVALIAIQAFFITAFIYFLQYSILPLSNDLLSVLREIKIAGNSKNYFINIVKKDIEDDKQEIEAIKNHFFDYRGRAAKQFIIFLEDAAKRNNLSQTIGTLLADNPPMTTISVSGSFSNVMTFLKQMENERILLKVESVSMQASAGKVDATIKVTMPLP
ncbi:MAG: hypothetical protein UX74_C0012G0006 [Parcubacteria group bacterium GW2011_GWA2_47_10b]|nr:MAG: hypothetical protein UX74_C0012G0006 [Parcubacteria group bacterium GW2011_GWA2_47_10b]